MVMVTSDGAAVMLGRNTGVAERLKQELGRHIIEFHCVAHLEALAVKDVLKHPSHSDILRMELIVNDMVIFLSTHKHKDLLHELAESLKSHLNHLERWIEIKWLSQARSVASVVKSLPVIQLYLANASNTYPSAEGIYKQISSVRSLVLIHGMTDVLDQLNRLNMMLQSKTVHPLDVKDLYTSICDLLQTMYNGDVWKNKGLKLLRSRLTSDDVSEQLKYFLPKSYRHLNPEAVEAKITQEENSAIEQLKAFVDDVIIALHERLGTSKEILTATKIFDPRTFASMDAQTFRNYGEMELDLLAQHYSAQGMDIEDAQTEYKLLKVQCLNPLKKDSMLPSWTEVL